MVLSGIPACATSTKPPKRGISSAPEATAFQPLPKLKKGIQLPITEVPRVDGTGFDLTALQGKIVIVEWSASWVDSWKQSYPLYNDLLITYGAQQLAVILISLDHDGERLHPEPGVRTRGFELGWDPQGALAAKLQLAVLPTLVIMDTNGKIALVEQGDVDFAQVRDTVQQLIASKA